MCGVGVVNKVLAEQHAGEATSAHKHTHNYYTGEISFVSVTLGLFAKYCRMMPSSCRKRTIRKYFPGETEGKRGDVA